MPQSGEAIDGLIMTPGRCKFDPKTITCLSGDGPNCLTSGQTQALEKILHGPVNSSGVQISPGYPPGHNDDYSAFITGNGTKDSFPSSQRQLQDIYLRYFIFGPNFDPVTQFNFDKHPAVIWHLLLASRIPPARTSPRSGHTAEN